MGLGLGALLAGFAIGDDINGIAGAAEAEPSDSDLSESDDEDLGEALEAVADSERAGQETAPMTGPTSIAPLEGTFHTGRLPRASAAALASIDNESAASDVMGEGKLGLGFGSGRN